MENALQVGESHAVDRARRAPATGPRQQPRVIEVRPSIDVFENGDGIRIVADVPGVDAAHAEVYVEMPHLRIACTRSGAGDTTIRYAAGLTLPSTIDGESLLAELHDGVLEISMHTSAKARARRIQVNGS